MKVFKIWFIGLMILTVNAACSSEGENATLEQSSRGAVASEILVSAASSLTDALTEIQVLYENENNVTLTFNFAGSGKLAQQIQQGAPVDVFISANESWMNRLEEEGLVSADSRYDITGNKIVLIASKNSSLNYETFSELRSDEETQIAIGNPESVPAGEYTEHILKAIGKWNELEEKLIFAQDVRQVLTYVETGNVEIGFVYESDARNSNKVKVLAEADPSLHDAIIYPGAITTEAKNKEAAQQFLHFLMSDEAQAILSKYGFNKN